MTTSTSTHLNRLTVKETTDALSSVINALTHNDNGALVAGADIEIVSYGVSNNLQVRDYLMGLPVSLGLGESFNVVTAIRNMAEQLGADTMALDTVLAAYSLMNDEPRNAERLLSKGLENNYALANLLHRVIVAGWPADALLSMAQELAPLVDIELLNTAHDLVNESLRDSEE